MQSKLALSLSYSKLQSINVGATDFNTCGGDILRWRKLWAVPFHWFGSWPCHFSFNMLFSLHFFLTSLFYLAKYLGVVARGHWNITFSYVCMKFSQEGNQKTFFLSQRNKGGSLKQEFLFWFLIYVYIHTYVWESLLFNLHLTGFPNPSGECAKWAQGTLCSSS